MYVRGNVCGIMGVDKVEFGKGDYSMIHILNRKELLTTISDQQLYRIQSVLSSANIPYRTKSNIPLLSSNRYRGIPCINSDASHPTVIYVKATDYDHAKMVIQTVL